MWTDGCSSVALEIYSATGGFIKPLICKLRSWKLFGIDDVKYGFEGFCSLTSAQFHYHRMITSNCFSCFITSFLLSFALCLSALLYSSAINHVLTTNQRVIVNPQVTSSKIQKKQSIKLIALCGLQMFYFFFFLSLTTFLRFHAMPPILRSIS